MRVLLVYPDARQELIGWGDLGAIAEPLALEYLAGGTRADGHETRILDLRLHRDALDPTLTDFAPDLVGVTGYSMHVPRMLEICARAKQLRPGCFTVVGGHHATLLPEDFFEPQVDFVVRGEGTHPLCALLRHLSAGDAVPPLPGVWSRREGQFADGGPAARFSVDDLPLPDRTLVPEDRPKYFIDWMQPIALMRSSVGCPYRCTFCSLWKIMDGRYLKRGVERVVDELARIPEEFVFFVDDEAFVDGNRMMELAEAIKASGLRKRYFTYCRIDTLLRQPKLMEAWREVGLERLFIGIEAVTQERLKSYNKRLEVAQVEEGLRAAKDLDIKVFAGFIVDTAFTQKDFGRLARFIEHNRVDYPSFTIWTPLPGTEALTTFEHVTERQPNGRPDWAQFDLQHAVVETRLPREQFLQEYRNLQRLFSGRITQHRDRGALQRAQALKPGASRASF